LSFLTSPEKVSTKVLNNLFTKCFTKSHKGNIYNLEWEPSIHPINSYQYCPFWHPRKSSHQFIYKMFYEKSQRKYITPSENIQYILLIFSFLTSPEKVSTKVLTNLFTKCFIKSHKRKYIYNTYREPSIHPINIFLFDILPKRFSTIYLQNV